MLEESLPSELLELDREELRLTLTKRGKSRQLLFAVMLKFFQWQGRHISNQDKVPLELLASLCDELKVAPDLFDALEFDSQKRFRKNIRDFFGYRECKADDVKRLINWLMQEIIPQGFTDIQCLDHAYKFFRHNKIEPLSSSMMKRRVNSAQHQFESSFFKEIHKSLSLSAKKALDRLMKEGDMQLADLKKDLSSTKYKDVLYELEKLAFIKSLNLPTHLLQNVSGKFLKKFYVRILGNYASHIEEYETKNRYGRLAIFCFLRGQMILDSLADLLTQVVRKIKRSSEIHVVKRATQEIKKVDGKFDILYTLANTAAHHPKGSIEKTLYPKVSQETLFNLAEELRYRGGWYRDHVQTKMKSLYSHSHRRLLVPLLEALEFETDNEEGVQVLKGVEWVLKYREQRGSFYPSSENIPMEGVISSGWRSCVMEEGGKVHRMLYEMALFETLSQKLEHKIIWIKGSYRYRNPDEDSPKDFDQKKEFYYDLLDLPIESNPFVKKLEKALRQGLKTLNQAMTSNPKVKIVPVKRGKGWRIKLSPASPQARPVNLNSLHRIIRKQWEGTSLLDAFKETDLRLSFTRHFVPIGRREAMDKSKLRKQLLLCIYGIGSNMGLVRVGAANQDVVYDDLKYTKSRYLTVDNVKAAAVQVVNAIIKVRDPEIWGEATTGVACDSTQVSSWDQNLMTEWHPRYHEPGVMIYWHVDRNSAVVHSLLKTCTSSEVGSMLTGILRHDTKMDINEAYVDTHGQSVIGFGFSYLLHFDLLPRLKNISKQKLYYTGGKEDYSQIETILKGSINWSLIQKHYHEVVRLAASLKMGSVEAEVLIKRFSASNYNHPVYQALNEIGKVAKTLFLCRYLSTEALRIEIHDALNVVERVNSIMGFIFYGKLGEVSTNKRAGQELSVACLHLLQVSMVYINTLIIQEVLSRPVWRNRLTKEDKRALTPLIHGHINPYGLFPLNLDERLVIERAA